MYHSKVMSGLANLIEPILKLNLTKETDYQIMEWIRETALLPMRYTQVTFFTMSMLLSGLEIVYIEI